MSAKIRTSRELKEALVRVRMDSDNWTEVYRRSANVILGDIDAVMINAWSAMSDMGYTKADYNKIKSLVKKRL